MQLTPWVDFYIRGGKGGGALEISSLPAHRPSPPVILIREGVLSPFSPRSQIYTLGKDREAVSLFHNWILYTFLPLTAPVIHFSQEPSQSHLSHCSNSSCSMAPWWDTVQILRKLATCRLMDVCIIFSFLPLQWYNKHPWTYNFVYRRFYV